MAGESPDRAKAQNSGPQGGPERRDGAAGHDDAQHDPRLAMARKAPSARSASAAGRSADGPAPKSPTGAKSAGESSADAGSPETSDPADPEGSSHGETRDGGESVASTDAPGDEGGTDAAGAADGEPRDARLREAVAAWVSGAAGSAGAGESVAVDGGSVDGGSGTGTDSRADGGSGAQPGSRADTRSRGEVPAPSGRSGVDQATAVFQLPRRPVDQPTTTLKLGELPGAGAAISGAGADGDESVSARENGQEAVAGAKDEPDALEGAAGEVAATGAAEAGVTVEGEGPGTASDEVGGGAVGDVADETGETGEADKSPSAVSEAGRASAASTPADPAQTQTQGETGDDTDKQDKADSDQGQGTQDSRAGQQDSRADESDRENDRRDTRTSGSSDASDEGEDKYRGEDRDEDAGSGKSPGAGAQRNGNSQERRNADSQEATTPPPNATLALKSPASANKSANAGSDAEAAPDSKGDGAAGSTSPSSSAAATAPAEPAAQKRLPSPAAPSDLERTSKFVALKDVEERRPTERPAGAKPSAPAGAAPAAVASTGERPQAPGTGSGTGTGSGSGSGSGSGTLTGSDRDETPGADPDGFGRTRQQPLPPKPPLDLLAELTNTPPPPQTPLRTVARRVKIWSPLVVLLAIVFVVAQMVRPLPEPTLSLTADAKFVFEGEKPQMPWPAQGQAAMEVEGVGTFGASGEQKPVPIASVAKVMTAYIVLRDHPIKRGTDGPMITMDAQAEKDAAKSAEGESTVDVREGQQISEKEAIQAVMLASANNVARRLARWDADSEKAFVEKMNATAKELGMANTTYTDPSGLTASTVSTAEDQVKLGKKAMEIPLFREIVGQSAYVDVNGKEQKNWNRLVPVDGVVGIKTGTTTKAGGNLLFAATKEVDGTRQTIIGAVLSQPPAARDNSILTGALDAGNALMQAARGVLEAKTVVRKGDVVGTVDDGLGGTVPVVVTKDVTAVGWPGLTVELKLADDGKSLPHQAAAGTEVGVLRVGDGTAGATEVPVALQRDLSEPGFADKLTRIG